MTAKKRIAPLISICMPTYNRAIYLEQSLLSISKQLNKRNQDKVELIIVDDGSKDDSLNVIKKYSAKIKNFKIYRNKKNLGIIKNIVRPGGHAKGKYVWYFSDDDLMKNSAINTLIKYLEKYQPDVTLINVAYLLKNKILKTNLLGINKDYFFKNKSEFFTFLVGKFFYKVDWYNTYMSNFVVKREIAKKSLAMPKKYPYDWALFPHLAPVYYYSDDYSFLLISEALVKFRAGNTSWGPKEKLTFLKFWDISLTKHYQLILKGNKKYIGFLFRLELFVKAWIRRAKILFISVYSPFSYLIS